MYNVKVIRKPNEDLESMIRRFRRRMERFKVIDDYKSHLYYIKPSDRRRAKNKARRNQPAT